MKEKGIKISAIANADSATHRRRREDLASISAREASPRKLDRQWRVPRRLVRERSGLLILSRPCLLKFFGRSPQLDVGADISSRRLFSRDRRKVVPRNPFCKMMGEVIVEMEIQ